MMRGVSAIVLVAVAVTACTGSDGAAPAAPITSQPVAPQSTSASTTPAASTTTSTSSSTTSTTEVLSLLQPVTPPAPEDCGPDVVCTAGWLVDPAPLEASLGLAIDEFRHAVAALGVITRVVEWDGVPEPRMIAEAPPEAPYTEVRQQDGLVVGFVDVPWSLEEAEGPTELIYVLHRVLPMEERQVHQLAEELGFTTRVGYRGITRDDGLYEGEHFHFALEGERNPWRLTVTVEDGVVEHVAEAG